MDSHQDLRFFARESRLVSLCVVVVFLTAVDLCSVGITGVLLFDSSSDEIIQGFVSSLSVNVFLVFFLTTIFHFFFA